MHRMIARQTIALIVVQRWRGRGMKTIIKRGTKIITTCKDCGCVFSYESEDVLEKSLDGYQTFKSYITCPQCENEIVLIPNGIVKFNKIVKT